MGAELADLAAVKAKAMERRDLIKKGLKIGAAAYVVPTLLASQAVSAAGPSGINPLCAGKTCTNFSACNGNSNCSCLSTFDGRGFCLNNLTQPFCNTLTPCPSGSCPAGSICAINTCCGSPVCVSFSNACPAPGTTFSAIPVPSGSGPRPSQP